MRVHSDSAFYSTGSSSLINQRQLFLACLLSEGEDFKSCLKQFWHTNDVWWKVLKVLLFTDVLRNMQGNEFIFSFSLLSFCPLSLKEAGFLSPCEETPLQLSNQKSFYHASFVMPRHPGGSADIDRSVSLPSPPLHACRMVWHLPAARSDAAAASPASLGSSLCREGSAGSAGCWHASGLDVKLIDTTWIFGDDARRKNRRPVR